MLFVLKRPYYIKQKCKILKRIVLNNSIDYVILDAKIIRSATQGNILYIFHLAITIKETKVYT